MVAVMSLPAKHTRYRAGTRRHQLSTGTAYSGPVDVNACFANIGTAAPFSAANAITGYTDNCGGSVTATLTGTATSGDDCGWTVTYTFTVEDGCGNELTGQTYEISGRDQTAPALTGTAYSGPVDVNACFANIGTAAPFSAANAITGYTDNCGGSVTATLTGTATSGDDCGWTVTYTFTVEDGCGNKLTGQTYEISGRDQTAPALTGTAYSGPVDVNACFANIGTAAPFSAANAITGHTDNCGGSVTATLTGTATSGDDCGWTVTYTFTVEDGCGNELTGQTYEISGRDQTAPALTGTAYSGPVDVNACFANIGTAAPFSAANAITGYTDNCGGSVTATLTGTATSGDDCGWTVTYTFTVEDGCGNELTGQTYEISGRDQTAPALTGTAYSGPVDVNACFANIGTAAPFSAANAITGYTDNCGGSVTATLTGTATSGDDCGWTVTYTFTVEDGCGNKLTGQTYEISGRDQTAPALTGTAYSGPVDVNACFANIGTAAPFSAANAITGYTDNCGGSVTATLTGTATSGDDCGWTVTYTFTVEDGCGNELTGQTYEISGRDQTAPALTGTAYSGPVDVNACFANIGTAAPFSAANAITGYTDNCGGSVTATLTGTATSGDDCGWTVTYTFTVEDGCGNELTGQTYRDIGQGPDGTSSDRNSIFRSC